MRGRAKQLGIKMNEYGLFRDDVLIPCASEQDVFSALGLAWVPPELRENTGEIEAAGTGVMPSLVEMKDIRGIFHIHTTASDGSSSLEEIVAAAKKMGLEYIGIADHSEAAFYAGGLTPEAIRRQHDGHRRDEPEGPRASTSSRASRRTSCPTGDWITTMRPSRASIS